VFSNPKLQNVRVVCDLLVVFDNIAIIWQIKDLKLIKWQVQKSELTKTSATFWGYSPNV
jgi:hypothetical protein